MEQVEFEDPIHGIMKIPEACVKIINTKWFQRLRNVKQLGGVYYVFPSATHTRFEHSIGTCWLAGELLKLLKSKINRNDSGMEKACNAISEKTILCVQIAALCHDLGHGPWSHLYDQRYLPKLAIHYTYLTHEQMAGKIFDIIYKDLEDYFKNIKFPSSTNPQDKLFCKEDVRFIKDLILPGERRSRKEKKEFCFLYQIVNNSVFEVDVDKWDYLLRDAHYTNQKVKLKKGYLSERLVIEKKSDAFVLHVKEEAVDDLYDIFSDRKMMHKKVYQHKTKNAVELMIMDILETAEKDLEYTINGCKLSEMAQSSNIDKFDMADHNILTELEREMTKMQRSGIQMSVAQKKIFDIFDRIAKRDVYFNFLQYEFIDAQLKNFDQGDKIKICKLFVKFISSEENVRNLFEGSGNIETDATLTQALLNHLEALKLDDFEVDVAPFNYGSGVAHAAQAAPFHRQHTTFPFGYNDLPAPIVLWNTILRIYCKKTLYKKLLRALPIRMCAVIPTDSSFNKEGTPRCVSIEIRRRVESFEEGSNLQIAQPESEKFDLLFYQIEQKLSAGTLKELLKNIEDAQKIVVA